MSLMGRLGRIMVENSAWEKEICRGQNTLLEPPTTKKKIKNKSNLDSRQPGSPSTKILLSLCPPCLLSYHPHHDPNRRLIHALASADLQHLCTCREEMSCSLPHSIFIRDTTTIQLCFKDPPSWPNGVTSLPPQNKCHRHITHTQQQQQKNSP